MSDRDNREFAPIGRFPPPRPPAELTTIAARISAIERLFDALEERVTELEASPPTAGRR
ncbi:hypothetical protein UFOVP1244_95 [uncultured Caudovirales phage]|uniref:Uncharacterized protein n=1 Tax=uncultured Caudovirales phage TaxID=2100421 RepID=A0A6J5R7C1_9CAUD|nr:hypothetical protein UFOVP1244_95 [uncultured Caudovirales phage]